MFAYASMMVTGIASGYLFFECNKYLMPMIMMLGVALVVRKIDLEYRPERSDFERRVLIAFLMVGFLAFACEYIQMNGRILDEEKREIAIEDISGFQGRIVGIEERQNANAATWQSDKYYRLIIKPMSLWGAGKIMMNYYAPLSPFLTGTSEENVPVRNGLMGAIVTVYGEARVAAGVENPGCFNYRSYLYSKGIRLTYKCKYMKVDMLPAEETGVKGFISKWYWAYRNKIVETREKFLDNFEDNSRVETNERTNESTNGSSLSLLDKNPKKTVPHWKNEAFLRGIVFGDKSEIDEETLEEFNTNSTGHILAVSGLHVGFLFALLKMLTRKKKSKLITASIIVVIVLYGEMTGWSPSTARAVLVLSISILAIYARRTPDLLTSVSTAAIILLLYNPYNLVNTGFQMSFLALLGICFLTEPLSHYIGEGLAVMVAIQLAVAPMVAYSYNSFNISSMFVNIPIVFLASILVPACILALATMMYVGFVPDWAVEIISALTEFIVELNEALTLDKLFVTDIQGISIGVLVAYYLLLFFASSEWTRIKLLRNEHKTIERMIPYLLVPALCIGIATHNQYLNDEIVFVNVGQGDCTHIRAGDTDVLIDGGGSATYNVGKNTLKPYLLKNHAANIDLALITHQHTDHYKGIEELKEIYPIRAVLQASIGNNAKLGNNILIEPIWPLKPYTDEQLSDNANENNTVYIIHYNNIKTMITGDLTEPDELAMVEHYRGTDVLDCDILKVGHHGSKTSSSEAFLDAVSPTIAIISVGANNTYGHPNQETLDKLSARGITTYRTDLNGAIGVDIRGTVLMGILCTGGQSLKIDTMR